MVLQYELKVMIDRVKTECVGNDIRPKNGLLQLMPEKKDRYVKPFLFLFFKTYDFSCCDFC